MNFPSSPWKPGSGSHLASRKEKARNSNEMVHLIHQRLEKDEGKSNSCNPVENFKHVMMFQGSKAKCLIYRIHTGNEQFTWSEVE